ncbi:hypothetical protein Q1695_005205 [Nippostrongylus brasiliensis]|nr:hypothetical protein Q1695_005205 [Nippostrongylus brasiliensis]
MSPDDDEKKAEKRAKSEAQRLASIKAKKELEKQRQAILSQALKEVDQKSKRVVFEDSDGGSEEETPSTGAKAVPKSQRNGSSIKLFGESSSEDEDEDTIKIANRHEGKKGEKLMKLEARFTSDSRFKLDEKFVSSESEDDEENEVVQERTKNLELLSKVLGSTVKAQKKTLKVSEKGSDGKEKVRPFTRFDPFNEEHVRWMEKEKVGSRKLLNIKNLYDPLVPAQLAGSEPAAQDDDEGADSKESDQKQIGIHYEMQPDFAEELKSRMAAEDANSEDKAGGFSFLAMMGRAAQAEEGGDDLAEQSYAIPAKRVANVKFFVTGEEQHLQSLVSNFKRTQPLENIVPRWGNHRDVFFKNYKHLRKEALKTAKLKNSVGKSAGQVKNGKTFPKKEQRKVEG